MLVLAKLYEQSNQSFIDQSVLTPLNVHEADHATTGYSICTLTQLSSHVSGSRVTNLKGRGVNKTEWIDLPSVLTHQGLPDTKDKACDQETVGQFPHIAQFAKHFPQIDLDLPVALLIGTDCGGAMKSTCNGSTYP